uniref:hypoxia-inducible factor-proline dioxygenase n=1 Tax=Strigamia maritima TaxID=126957 RepID=T1IPR5_STRMM
MAARLCGENRSCQYCGKEDNLKQCSRCRSVLYCSRAHQKKHWKIHKETCGNENTDTNNTGAIIIQEDDIVGLLHKTVVATQEKSVQHTKRTSNGDVSGSKSGVNTNSDEMTSKTVRDDIDAISSSQERSPLLTSNSKVNGKSLNHQQHMAFSFQQQKKEKLHSFYAEKILSNTNQCQQMCDQIINDLNMYGICVIDKFLGEELGSAILGEVCDMYRSGVFKDGQLVSHKVKDSSTTIRGDKITWVDGSEQDCAHIGDLISIVDSLIALCKNRANNGELGKHNIGERTKAMVACYPGGGTQYVKHVDNPNQDGRCITSIYYLNKDWNEKRGGLLRIFPDGNDEQIANIVPIFDRLIFFWSDRRNPHEVQASYETRYAITLWYFDKHEREKYNKAQRK